MLHIVAEYQRGHGRFRVPAGLRRGKGRRPSCTRFSPKYNTDRAGVLPSRRCRLSMPPPVARRSCVRALFIRGCLRHSTNFSCTMITAAGWEEVVRVREGAGCRCRCCLRLAVVLLVSSPEWTFSFLHPHGQLSYVFFTYLSGPPSRKTSPAIL
jgi:hypothetical protein